MRAATKPWLGGKPQQQHREGHSKASGVQVREGEVRAGDWIDRDAEDSISTLVIGFERRLRPERWTPPGLSVSKAGKHIPSDHQACAWSSRNVPRVMSIAAWARDRG
jgi:hypothetical protein